MGLSVLNNVIWSQYTCLNAAYYSNGIDIVLVICVLVWCGPANVFAEQRQNHFVGDIDMPVMNQFFVQRNNAELHGKIGPGIVASPNP